MRMLHSVGDPQMNICFAPFVRAEEQDDDLRRTNGLQQNKVGYFSWMSKNHKLIQKILVLPKCRFSSNVVALLHIWIFRCCLVFALNIFLCENIWPGAVMGFRRQILALWGALDWKAKAEGEPFWVRSKDHLLSIFDR